MVVRCLYRLDGVEVKFSVDCSLCLDSSVRCFSMVVKYLESSYVVGLFVVDKCVHLVVEVCLVHDKSYAPFV